MVSPSMDGPEVQAVTDTSGYTVPSPLTLAGIGKRRAAAGKLIAGVAAYADLESFKGREQHAHKPMAVRLDRKHRFLVSTI